MNFLLPRSWLTIKNKIILMISLMLGIVFLGVGLIVYQQIKASQYDKIQVRMEALSQKLRDEIDEQYEEHKFPRIAKLNRIISENLPFSRIQLFDSTGSSVYADTVISNCSLPLGEIDRRKKYFANIDIQKHKYRSLWTKIEIMENHHWLLQVATPIEGIEDDIGRLAIILGTTLSFALLLSAVVVNYIVRRSFHPLSEMIETANRISVSTLHERILYKKQEDEVAILASALNKMIERLESAFKHQKQFIADASHELRTPLTIIQSELEYALRSKTIMAIKNSLKVAMDEVEHLKKLASDLLLLSKLETSRHHLQIKRVRVDKLLAECVRGMKGASRRKNISLTLITHDIVELPLDEVKMKSVVLNLLENAIKYTPKGGFVEIQLEQKGSLVLIKVRDNGMGIPPQDLSLIFEPFYRSDVARADQHGSGLGLSIAKRIVELHQGTIEVQSDGAKGSLFIIKIPTSVNTSL